MPSSLLSSNRKLVIHFFIAYASLNYLVTYNEYTCTWRFLIPSSWEMYKPMNSASYSISLLVAWKSQQHAWCIISPSGEFSTGPRPDPLELEATFVKRAHYIDSFVSWRHWTSFLASLWRYGLESTTKSIITYDFIANIGLYLNILSHKYLSLYMIWPSFLTSQVFSSHS